MRKQHQSNLTFRVALVLFCLVLFSAHLSSGMLAKYKTEGDDLDTAGAAKAGFTVTSSSSSASVASDGSASYTFTVKDTGDVTVRYSLVVSLAPGAVSAEDADYVFSNVKIDGADGVYDDETGEYVFTNVGTFKPGDTADHTLTFDTNDFVSVSDSGSFLSYKNITVLISAKTTQVN